MSIAECSGKKIYCSKEGERSATRYSEFGQESGRRNALVEALIVPPFSVMSISVFPAGQYTAPRTGVKKPYFIMGAVYTAAE